MLVWFSPAYSPMGHGRCLNGCCARLGTSKVQYSARVSLTTPFALPSPKSLWVEQTAHSILSLSSEKHLMDSIKMYVMTRFEALSVERASSQSHLRPYPRIQNIGLRRCGE
jgi:hypothetical protein